MFEKNTYSEASGIHVATWSDWGSSVDGDTKCCHFWLKGVKVDGLAGWPRGDPGTRQKVPFICCTPPGFGSEEGVVSGGIYKVLSKDKSRYRPEGQAPGRTPDSSLRKSTIG